MPTSLFSEMDRGSNGGGAGVSFEDQRALQLAFELSMLGIPEGSSGCPGAGTGNGTNNDPDPLQAAPAVFEEARSKKSQNMTECVPVPSSEHVAEIVGRQGKCTSRSCVSLRVFFLSFSSGVPLAAPRVCRCYRHGRERREVLGCIDNKTDIQLRSLREKKKAFVFFGSRIIATFLGRDRTPWESHRWDDSKVPSVLFSKSHRDTASVIFLFFFFPLLPLPPPLSFSLVSLSFRTSRLAESRAIIAPLTVHWHGCKRGARRGKLDTGHDRAIKPIYVRISVRARARMRPTWTGREATRPPSPAPQPVVGRGRYGPVPFLSFFFPLARFLYYPPPFSTTEAAE